MTMLLTPMPEPKMEVLPERLLCGRGRGKNAGRSRLRGSVIHTFPRGCANHFRKSRTTVIDRLGLGIKDRRTRTVLPRLLMIHGACNRRKKETERSRKEREDGR